MEITQKERQTRGLDLLGAQLAELVDQRMSEAVPGRPWLPLYEAKESARLGRPFTAKLEDPRLMLRILRHERAVFTEIEATQRAWLEELVQASNRAAHAITLDIRQVDRALDTMLLLADSLGLEAVVDQLSELRAEGTVESAATDAASELQTAPPGDAAAIAPAAQVDSVLLEDRGVLGVVLGLGEVTAEVVLHEALNYALVHNGVSPVLGVRLRCSGDVPTEEVRVRLDLVAPSFPDSVIAAPLEFNLASLEAGEEVEVAQRALGWRVNPTAFLQLDEATELVATVTLNVGTRTGSAQGTLRALPADEWWGSGTPSSLAAFVRPNDQAIPHLLAEASRLLTERTGSPSLEGYQGGAERVHNIAEAIYEAMRRREITYVEPPSSFEGTGQRIRSHSEVLDRRVGTCLDLACTYAAALEQAGLNPVLVVAEGHAFCGYLVEESRLPETVIATAAAIRTVADSDLLEAVETTKLCAGPSQDFDAARGAARHWWTGGIDKVAGIVDVRAAHRAFRPIPTIRFEGDTRIVEVVREVAAAPVRKDPRRNLEAGPTESAPARVARWKRSLLDLTYANPLLKLKPASSASVHVPTGALGRIEDHLAAGSALELIASDLLSQLYGELGVRSAADLDPDVLRRELDEAKRLFLAMTEREAGARLKTLQRRATTSREETGTDSLYLALGSLRWAERARSGDAPLFLVPIRLTGGRGGKRYSIEQDPTRDVEPNFCLHEKLRNEFGLELPELVDPGLDESGLDIEGALQSIRRRLLEHKAMSFHVEETACIATFQFSTLGMWRDLQENWPSLAAKPVVNHLIESAGKPYLDAVDAPLPDETAEATTYLPIPADGSQIQAVRWAAAGRSFILEGPPGTGKSQTITNLIAHCLAEGKKVLFVAEKPAALEVVQRRLDAVGLGTFSLDVHGSNQTVTAVRTQLQEAIEYAAPGSAGWESLRATYRGLVQSLAHYPRHLHEAGPAGLSAWGARQIVLELGEAVSSDAPEVGVEPWVAAGQGDLSVLYDAAASLGEALQSLGVVPDASPWRLAGPLAPDQILDRAAVAAALARLEAAERAVDASQVGELLDSTEATGTQDLLARWLDSVSWGTGYDPAQVRSVVTAQWRQQVADVSRSLQQLTARHQATMARFSPEIIERDLSALLVQAEAADRKFFGKKKARLAVSETLRPYQLGGGLVDPAQTSATVRMLAEVRAEVARLMPYVQSIPGLGVTPTFNPFRESDRVLLSTRMAAFAAAGDLGAKSALPAASVGEVLRTRGPGGAGVRELVQARQGLLAALRVTDKDLQAWQRGEPWRVARERSRLSWTTDSASQTLILLERWVRVRTAAERLAAVGAGEVVAMALSGQLRGADVEPVVRLAVARAILDERLDTTNLRAFDPEHHARLVERFVSTGSDFRERLIAELPAKIVGARTFDARRQIGDVGELQQQIGRRRGGMSIRSLMHRFAPIMTQVTPCFLMSPASVAKFLPAGSIDFDVVVFDEASQIRVPEAIGAMGRGHSVVIVGDSKQMPPSSMFSASGANDEDENNGDGGLPVPVDMDSILTEAVESNLPRLMLSWHYRSRDESLIAFSNQHYYDGRLASFPTPPRLDGPTAVHLRRVPGTWEGGSRGAARVNREEADAVCAEVGRLLAENPGRSLGVVTFNTQQRDLILDTLERQAEGDRSLADALTRNVEPLFVKNLENVQGDERDVILFTLAFARDARGKVPLNWGPLTRVGGEKRFNVAVTRAKEQVMVFCSFDPHELDLSTSRSEGLAHLKDYLLLARDGAGHALAHRPSSYDLHLNEVKRRLEAEGLEVRASIGLSTFTIDLAVRATAEHEWLAVLLDGPQWAERESVGDRDGLPASVLTKQMGWAGVARIWLAEWLRDSGAVVKRIQTEAERLDGSETASAARQEAVPPIEPLLPDLLLPDPREPAPDLVLQLRSASPTPGIQSLRAEEEGAASTLPGSSRFAAASPRQVQARSLLDESGRRAAQAVVSELDAVSQEEGPVLVGRLAKLVAHRFGLDRLRETREAQILNHLNRALVVRSSNGDQVVWPHGVEAAAYSGFRVPGDPRVVADVPYEELRNAMVAVVRSAFALSEDDLLRETARAFGWSRLGANVRDRLVSVLKAATREGVLESVAGQVKIRE